MERSTSAVLSTTTTASIPCPHDYRASAPVPRADSTVSQVQHRSRPGCGRRARPGSGRLVHESQRVVEMRGAAADDHPEAGYGVVVTTASSAATTGSSDAPATQTTGSGTPHATAAATTPARIR